MSWRPIVQHVAEARRGHQRGAARPCPRGSCWWRRSCRAARGRAPARPRAGIGQRQPHAGQEGLRRIARHARRLGAPDLAARGVVQGDVGEGAADIDGDGEGGSSAEGCRHSAWRWKAFDSRDAWRAARAWHVVVDRVADDRDAVDRAAPPRPVTKPPSTSSQHALGRPVERMAVAAAAAGLDAQHVAALQHVAVGRAAAAARSWLVPGLTTARPVPPAMPPAMPHGGFFTLSMRTASIASSARMSYSRTMPQPPRQLPGAAGIGEDAVGAQPHRIADLEELDRVVLLRHEIDRVGAVGGGARAPADADAVRHQERLELALGVR